MFQYDDNVSEYDNSNDDEWKRPKEKRKKERNCRIINGLLKIVYLRIMENISNQSVLGIT